MQIFQQISEFLQQGNEAKVYELTEKAIHEKISPKDILDNGLIAGMNVVGEKFREHEIFLPEVLLAAKAMYAGMNQLKPLLIKGGIPSQGKIVLGTVQGDIHNLGKNLVATMLEGAGFQVIDAGEDVSPQKFVELAASEKAQLVGMSALLTTTMPYMKSTIEALREAGLAGQVKTIVGGACVTQRFADEIGADAFAENAGAAVAEVKKALGSK